MESCSCLQDMGRLQLARAFLGSQRRSTQPSLYCFCSSAVTKGSERSSSSAEESPSASASEHAGGNVAEFYRPNDVLESTASDELVTSDEDSFAAALIIDEGEAVYDFCWYPRMTTTDASTCTFATSTRDHLVHLWDAVSGQLQCTFRAYDAMDEITAAYSVAFNNSGSRLFCGYNKTLKVFDTSRPGREFSQHSTLTRTRDGQTGIISCLAFSPSSEGLFAAGSYNKTTALYSEHNAELLCVLHGQEGGVTQDMGRLPCDVFFNFLGMALKHHQFIGSSK